MTHTKEPWEINGCDWDQETDTTIGSEIVDSEFYFVASCEGGRSSDHDNANAARIVACVNALAGIPDPAAYVAAFDAMQEALKALIVAVTFADPPIKFNDVLCHDARVPVEFVGSARTALQSARTAQGNT